MASVVLGYKISSCCGWFEAPGGWSFDIFHKGTVRFKTYLINGTVTSSRKITIPQSVVNVLQKELQKWEEAIVQLPTEINNHSCDGAYYRFNFLGKKITSLNISRYPEEYIHQAEREGYFDNEIAQTMRAENKVLDIFESVTPTLVPLGFSAVFEPSFYCHWDGVDPDKYAIKPASPHTRDKKIEIPKWMDATGAKEKT